MEALQGGPAQEMLPGHSATLTMTNYSFGKTKTENVTHSILKYIFSNSTPDGFLSQNTQVFQKETSSALNRKTFFKVK